MERISPKFLSKSEERGKYLLGGASGDWRRKMQIWQSGSGSSILARRTIQRSPSVGGWSGARQRLRSLLPFYV
nr:MAG TPA: hypothetical protein [Caudoviricetes sp.]